MFAHGIWIGKGVIGSIFAGYESPASFAAKFRKCVSFVAWRFWQTSERRAGEAPKARGLPPQSPRGITALAHLAFFARPTKTAMLRRLENLRPHSSDCRKCNPIIINQVMKM